MRGALNTHAHIVVVVPIMKVKGQSVDELLLRASVSIASIKVIV